MVATKPGWASDENGNITSQKTFQTNRVSQLQFDLVKLKNPRTSRTIISIIFVEPLMF